MSDLMIGGRPIGEEHPCFVIAEAGANHNRDLVMAKELIAVGESSRDQGIAAAELAQWMLFERRYDAEQMI